MDLLSFAQKLHTQLLKSNKIVILTHNNPDGDAIGSSLAMFHMLDKKGKKVKAIVPNDFPKFLKWMPRSKEVINAEFKNHEAKKAIAEADLIFCLDFNTPSRIEHLQKSLEEAKGFKVLIDHHQEPSTFDLMYSDTTQPATCQMVYKLFEAMEWISDIDVNIASCLYTGIITDTGNFKYRNTTSETHIIAAKIMDFGIEIDAINTQIFDSSSPDRLKLLGIVLSRAEVVEESHTSFLYVYRNELRNNNFMKGDTEGFVNYGLSMKGIKLTLFLAEDIQNNFVKLSFRSVGNVDVNRLAKTYFNGGGHLNAAGGRSDLSIEDTIAELKRIIKEDEIIVKELQA